MRHRDQDRKEHALDLYTFHITVDEFIETIMIQFKNKGYLKKTIQFLSEGKKKKFGISLTPEGN